MSLNFAASHRGAGSVAPQETGLGRQVPAEHTGPQGSPPDRPTGVPPGLYDSVFLGSGAVAGNSVPEMMATDSTTISGQRVQL